MKGVRKSFLWWCLGISVPLAALIILTYILAYIRQASSSKSDGYQQPPKLRSVTDANWYEFTSKEFGFTVSMPTPPKERTNVFETPQGRGAVHSFISDTGSVAFAVAFTELPASLGLEHFDTNKMELVFDITRNKMMGKDGKLLHERSILYKQYLGREIEINRFNDKARITARVFVVGSNTLTLTAMIPRPYNDPKSVSRFLDSFVLNTSTNR